MRSMVEGGGATPEEGERGHPPPPNQGGGGGWVYTSPVSRGRIGDLP